MTSGRIFHYDIVKKNARKYTEITLPKVKIRILNIFLSFNFANLSVKCNDEPKALGAKCYNYVGK